MKSIFLCIIVLTVGGICQIGEKCTVHDDRHSGTLEGKCQIKKDCLKSERAAVLYKNAAGDKACAGDDDSVQCCLEISCGGNKRCRNNLKENVCAGGTYQPNFRNHLFCPFTLSDKLACCVPKSTHNIRDIESDSSTDDGELVAQVPTQEPDNLPNAVPNYKLNEDGVNLNGPSVDELNKQNAAAHPELIDPTKPLTLANMKVTSDVTTVEAVKGLKVTKADSLLAPDKKQTWMWDFNTGSSAKPGSPFVLYNSQWKRPEIGIDLEFRR